jgi:hypothetical protein
MVAVGEAGGSSAVCVRLRPLLSYVRFEPLFIFLFFVYIYPSHFICISTEVGFLIKIVLACHLFGCQIVVAKILTFNWFDAKSKLSIFLGMP